MNKIFLDNASTTKPYKEVVSVLADAQTEDFFNPGALYAEGFCEKQKLEEKREDLLKYAGATNFDVVFVSSATEADNLALFQVKKNATVLIGAGEHPAIFETAQTLKERGVNVQSVPLAKDGKVDETAFKEMMTKDVSFVSIMHVSNETGAVNDIQKLCVYAKKVNPKVVFHSDGVQAFMKIPTSLASLGVDMYTVSSHKIHGPKGVGALFFKKNINIKSQMIGGGQEKGIRSGTENYPLVAGFIKAVELSYKNITENYKIVAQQKQELIEKLKRNDLNFEINGNEKEDLPYILSCSFLGVRGEVLLHSLENYGILVSTGSACSTKKIGNRILSNMGKNQIQIEGNIRFSFSADEPFDAKFVADAIKTELAKLKKIR